MKIAVVALGFAALLAADVGCSRKKKARVGPLKDWIVGKWVRVDDPLTWEFKADGELITEGALPITGSWQAQEPDTVVVTVSGANAITTSAQLGVPADPVSQTLTLTFKVRDDEMRVAGVASDALWIRN
jgi:hypothetical protein